MRAQSGGKQSTIISWQHVNPSQASSAAKSVSGDACTAGWLSANYNYSVVPFVAQRFFFVMCRSNANNKKGQSYHYYCLCCKLWYKSQLRHILQMCCVIPEIPRLNRTKLSSEKGLNRICCFPNLYRSLVIFWLIVNINVHVNIVIIFYSLCHN